MAFAQKDTNLEWRPDLYVPTFIAVGLVAYLLLRLTNGRLTISDISAGPAKLTLSDKNASYFDDYLDEIVYFFQASKRRILILEDMDRFSNIEVFEDLRALNVLLNHSAQLQSERLHGKNNVWNRLLKRRPWKQHARLNLEELETHGIVPEGFHDGPIIFIYAIRDSLLVDKVAATNDVRHDAFTRTKFFDLIVPVVPFITAQNARGALKTELDILAGEGESSAIHDAQARPSDDLVRGIAQYFPDQRQIRNIRNEFAMYRNRLLQPHGHPEELTPDRLLALVLYKNFSVADFELIRLGKSRLHRIHRLTQALINENLARISVRLSHPSEESRHARAKELAKHLIRRGEALKARLQRLVRDQYNRASYSVLNEEDLGDLDLWRSIVSGENLFYHDSYPLDRLGIEAGFDVSLDFADAEAVPLTKDEREQLENDRAVLESATWAKLWETPDFVLGQDSPAWTDKNRPSGPLSFAQIVVKIIGEGLATDLIAAGHLTRNFSLLSAHFNGEFLNIEAQNFLTSVTEKPGHRPLTPVSNQAIREILEDRSIGILNRSGMVNIHVLHYLLVERPDAAHLVLGQLRSWTADDQSFVRAFFERYGEQVLLPPLLDTVRYLAKLAPSVASFVAADSTVPNDRRVQLFDAAIGGVPLGDRTIAGIEDVRLYAQQVHGSLESLTREDRTAHSAANCLIELAVIIDDLRPLSASIRSLFIENGLFDMNLTNLSVFVDDEQPGWVSLERLQSSNDAYRATLSRIDEYLDLLQRQEDTADLVTVESAEALSIVLEDLSRSAEMDLDQEGSLRSTARFSAPNAQVRDFRENSVIVREALLLESRAEISTRNLLAHFNTSSGMTEGIAAALHENTRPDRTDESEGTDFTSFTTAVLGATGSFPSLLTAHTVSTFFEYLEGNFTISPASLLSAEPTVAVALIEDKTCELSDLRASANSVLDWRVREALLASEPSPGSSDIASLVLPEDVVPFLRSNSIALETKNTTEFNLDTFLNGQHAKRNAEEIVAFLTAQQLSIGLEGLHSLAIAGAGRPAILALLCKPPAKQEFFTEPSDTLRILGGDYAAIIDRHGNKSPTFPPTQENKDFLELLVGAGLIRMNKTKADGRLRIIRVG